MQTFNMPDIIRYSKLWMKSLVDDERVESLVDDERVEINLEEGKIFDEESSDEGGYEEFASSG